MKQVNFFVIAVAIFVGITFESCYSGENENAWDGYDCVTIIEEGALGERITLVGDFSGYTFIPSNPNFLQLQTNEYPERARIFYKFAADEVIIEGKTTYNIKIVSCDLLLPVNDFSRTEDISELTTPLIQLNDQNTWAVNNYINIGFTCYANEKTTAQNFDLFADKVENNNTLCVKLNHSEDVAVGSGYDSQGLISFRIPPFAQLSEFYSNLDLSNTLIPFGENKDSIYIKVMAEGRNNNVLELDPIKVKMKIQQ
ncbi:hypothetical protein EZS27_010443 [termite gut metagenome]|uniref:NigD-like C-terminal beta sandwich domain-containing protein n=1 Tax=termite gut metagenome TaxID=433724 RepID=A0A5J4S6R1_9ZZZZ